MAVGGPVRVRKSSVQVATPPPEDQEVEDIIPGRLTQAMWMDMLIQEEAEDIVGEIMLELMGKVMEGCLKVFIERQVTLIRHIYLTQFLEGRTLCLDEGEGLEEASQTEDSEPMPTISDVWLQGCVPVVTATAQHQATSQQVFFLHIFSSNLYPAVMCISQCNDVAQTYSSPKQCEKETSPRETFRDKHNKLLGPQPSSKADQNKKHQINLLPKPVRSKLLPPLSRSVQKKEVEVESENRTHSASYPSTGSVYKRKDHRPIPRLDPSHLPRHCISPQYEILNNDCTKPTLRQQNFKKPSRLSKPEHMRNQQTHWTITSLKPLTHSKDPPQEFQRRSEADLWLKKLSPSRHSKEGMRSSGPLRLDKLELATGVSLLDPQANNIDSFRFNFPVLPTKLRPIHSDAGVPLYSIEQVITGPPPQLMPTLQSSNRDH
uniref:Uncharacterized protein n=1 Tax=Mola mola TaxID=94237 RepID=A0A3Q3WEP7_MOLML